MLTGLHDKWFDDHAAEHEKYVEEYPVDEGDAQVSPGQAGAPAGAGVRSGAGPGLTGPGGGAGGCPGFAAARDRG